MKHEDWIVSLDGGFGGKWVTPRASTNSLQAIGVHTLNRGQLATRGASQSVAFEVAIPGSDLDYYKLTYNGQLFVPLGNTFTLRFRTELGYGDGFGDLDGMPFFNNFYAGGFASVRGYKANSLGPRGTPADIYGTGIACIAVSGTTCVGSADRYAYIVDPNTGKAVLRNQELSQPINEQINKVVEQLGSEGEFDMIIDVATVNVVFLADGIDLTQQVLEFLAASQE